MMDEDNDELIDAEHIGKTKNETWARNGKWADCFICKDFFGRRRQSQRFCSKCRNAFCDGEHGSYFYKDGRESICTICEYVIKQREGKFVFHKPYTPKYHMDDVTKS